jgi:4-aminobutyrate aminotransferase
MSESEWVRRGKKVIAPTLGWETELVALRAKGVEVACDDGRTYVDFTSGTGVLNIGHRHAHVVQAIKRQLEKVLHTGGNYWYESLVQLGEKLQAICPGNLGMFFFSNSGAEAVEGSLKLARYVTGRPAIVSFTGAFHGRTLGATSITGSNAKYRYRYKPLLPEVYAIPYPYTYRLTPDNDPEAATRIALDHLEQLFTHRVKPDEVAAVILEPVQGEGGYIPAPASFLREIRRITKEHDILLIFDEVQSGMARTCKWFACEHAGVVPDVMTIAKAIASGLPLSCVASTPAIMKNWTRGAHGTTFGGNPVAAAAAVATIEVIEKEDLLEIGMEKSRRVRERLAEIQKRHPTVGDVRGLGLMIGIELVGRDRKPDPEALQFVKAKWREEGFVVISCGTYGNVVRFIPPLVTPTRLLDRSLDILDDALAAYEKKR